MRRDQSRTSCALPEELCAALVAVLTSPLAPGETQLTGAARREQALRALFTQLSPAQALTLDNRLAADRDSDPVAVAFRRLKAERVARLRAFLAAVRVRRLAVTTPCK